MNAPIYMDYNATAPMCETAIAAMREALPMVGNASSTHRFGREQRRRLDWARQAVADLVGAAPADVIFTGGGTEANNLALNNKGDRRLLVSSIEHHSVLQPAEALGGAKVPVDRDGQIELGLLERALVCAERPAMVSVMFANNETGVIQPIADIVEICRRHGALLHCDATQAAGRLPIRMTELGIDYLTLSAHKIGGPQGVGALVTAPGRGISAQILGGGQERSRRAGTENVAGIFGFGAAALEAGKLAATGPVGALRDRLEKALRALEPELIVFGERAVRLSNTSCVAIRGKRAETLVMAMDLAGYAIGAGSACSSGKMRPSHVVEAMGFDVETARSAIRISLGPSNSKDHIDGFVAAFAAAIGRPWADRNAA